MRKSDPSTHELQRALDASNSHKLTSEAAKAVGLAETTFRRHVLLAKASGLKPSKKTTISATETIRRLERDLREAQKESADAANIKAIIQGLVNKSEDQSIPTWLQQTKKKHSGPGVPTLFLSDLHWGEKVHPTQIGGVNEYNTQIAHERLRTCVDRAMHLLHILDNDNRYPGIVVILGGDMVSGDIHEELAESNEMHTLPTVLDMEAQIAAAISLLADAYGHVFLPCVTGNHGRNTKKIRAKDRHHTSFDWLLYKLLEKRFQSDNRITFLIPDGPDAYYKVHNTAYLLTHGDQFRGGDGMIGALGPIIRGDHKKRSRNGQIDKDYDVLLCGHWHQYIHLTRLIVNGSLKGYDEYAYSSNFGFEPPQQALWVTHPKYGITFRMPVYVDSQRAVNKTEWVSVPRA